MSEPLAPDPDARRREGMLVARLLATLMAVSVAGMGLYFLHLGVYVGHNSKTGVDIALSGPPATALTIMLFGIAGLPLGLWARNGRQAALWMVACLAVAVTAFLVAVVFL